MFGTFITIIVNGQTEMVKDCHIAMETIFLCRDSLEMTRFNMGKRMLKQIPTFSGLQMITVYGELEVIRKGR
jgi:hypothetical protein